MKFLGDMLYMVWCWCLVLIGCYLIVASTVFHWRNPKAGQVTSWSLLYHVLRFEKLSEFQ